MGWYEERFQQAPGRLRFDCVACGRAMFFPPSKHGKYKTCGADCAAAARKAARIWVPCIHCGSMFTPRKSQLTAGGGRACSRACAAASGAWSYLTSSENLKRAQEARSRVVVRHKSGPDHHSWKGGDEAARARRAPKEAAYRRAYRRDNPEKTREWAQKRRGIGRLPRGTIPSIGKAQRWKCAACRGDIRNKYHVDHIEPLARGGKHEPRNIQLLCPSCNVRKSAKDPVQFMQERGFLL